MRQGKWYIDDDGRRCMKFEDQSKEKCHIIVNDGGVYKAFKINKRGKRQQTGVLKKFTEGNLYGL